MLRLPHHKKSRIQLGIIAAFLVTFAAVVWSVADYFDQIALNSQLQEAVVSNDIEKTKTILAEGADVDAQIHLGIQKLLGIDAGYDSAVTPPLVHAINQNNLAMVRLLIESGAEMYLSEPEYYETAMRWALYYCNQEAAAYFVYEVPRFDIQREDIDALLLLSAECGDIELVQFWLDNGADVRGPDPARLGYSLGNPLNKAVKGGHSEIVRVLVEHDARLDTVEKGYSGGTPLATACDARLPKMVQLLLELGADPNLISRGMTPLHYAVLAESPETVRVLLEAGADPAIVDKNGDTALAFAQKEGLPQVVQVFIDWTQQDVSTK